MSCIGFSENEVKQLSQALFLIFHCCRSETLLSIGANRFYYLCLNDQLAFGGGQNFALSIEEDL